MKKKLFMILPILALLASCNNTSSSSNGYKPGREYGDDKVYALFMYNYPRGTSESPNGYEEMVENTIYQKVEITVGELIAKPTVDPVRENYQFQGWHKEKECLSLWDFDTETAKGSTILYAKWGNDSGHEEYVEPEYIAPERIIDDMESENFRVTGILNKPVYENQVDLTAGGIARLKKHNTDISFAINFEHKQNSHITVATYIDGFSLIHIETNTGEEFNFKVNDITASLKISNTTYENKAKAYEAKGEDIENYHIALMGSSSMENWDTSTQDMDPIVSFNHGIGGTTVEQWTDSLLERLVLPYSPKAVVYYVGVNNIINSGDKGETTGNKLVALFNKTHEYLPNAHIFYVLINKLPLYGHCQADFDVANNMALDYENQHDYLTCIDAGKGLLKPNGSPHFGYFRPDGLHMSRIGYVIWGAAVKEAIKNWLG